jgi:hypothetical protein
MPIELRDMDPTFSRQSAHKGVRLPLRAGRDLPHMKIGGTRFC